MNAIFKKYKKKIEKDTTDKLLMGMAESFAMGINCKSNGSQMGLQTIIFFMT